MIQGFVLQRIFLITIRPLFSLENVDVTEKPKNDFDFAFYRYWKWFFSITVGLTFIKVKYDSLLTLQGSSSWTYFIFGLRFVIGGLIFWTRVLNSLNMQIWTLPPRSLLRGSYLSSTMETKNHHFSPASEPWLSENARDVHGFVKRRYSTSILSERFGLISSINVLVSISLLLKMLSIEKFASFFLACEWCKCEMAQK